METVDVAVVGAGPAGASAALAARRAGADVLLLDRADFPRDKACGDGIAAHALDVLAELGVSDAVAGYRPVPALRLVAPGGGQVARELPRPAYTVPRRVFDARLVAAALAAGARLRRHTVRRVECRAGLVVLDGTLAARAVVGADGAGSVVRRALGHGANPDGHLALAIRGYAPTAGDPVEQKIITSAAHWPGYAWSFPIGDGRANVGYGEVLAGRPLHRTQLLDRLAALLPEVAPDTVTELRAHHLPLSTRRPVPGRGRILLAGDALSLINPFTGEGIFYAVLSGSLAGAAAADFPDTAADRYASALRQRLGQHLRHSSAVASLARRRPVVDAVVRSAERDARVFRVLVELGLGDGRLDARTLARIAGVAAGSAARHFRQRI
ncbi:geranylgeranyl reductase family protein [Plantactinospora sp. S1510]|uniref:Geranylgeranyl reductase family protein n=1 Tax=Plantactinospora alkalitolerans TaxID=2789879 RepID=A0ABS0H4U7_9ACTN|nr:geranylgeranyl reductase family protein [Plantactinospora alkalitolerans]MBF9133489.1 geranylgeranyl reductase family protein [Plantactinospora alkalitolerans]